jgi:hypothetical protein
VTARRPGPEELYRAAWLVLGSMVAGVALLAGIAGIVRGAASSDLPWLGIWALAGPPSVVLAKVLQVRLVGRAAHRSDPARDRGPGGGAHPDDGAIGSIFTAHIVAWALVEGPAMLGAAAYLLGASPAVLVASLLTAAVGFALTAPRRDAFGLR